MIEQKDLSGAALAERISHYAANRSILAEMAAKARGLGRPHAAREIVDDMLGLLDTGPRRI
jgi:processive 1,2-diacylglycerol beta-glucosyltransferase